MFKLVRRLAGRPIQRRARRLAEDFLRQTERAGDVQRELLMSRIARHADSQFGRDHHFGEIRNPADFRRLVPVRGYDGHEPYIDRVRRGDLGALFGPGTEVLMFAMTSGTTDRPKTIPVTRESLADYREGWTIWGMHGLRRPPGDPPGGAPPDPPARQQLARALHPLGHPLRRDHRPDGADAEPDRPVHLLHAPGRLADQGHRVEILRGLAALGTPRPGDDHRRQPEHHPGHRPAGRPREGHPHPRPGRRHRRPEVDHPAGRPPGDPDQDPLEAQGGVAPARGDRRADRPAPPQGLLAQPRVPRQLDGGDDGGLSPRLSRILRRPPGPRHRPDRLRRADDDPDRGRHARRASWTSATITSSSCPRTRSAATSPRRSRPPT